MLVVDGITAVGATNIPMEIWGIDILITGSQKALMLPPGLAFLALSPKAWDRTKIARLPRFYFDLVKERKEQAKKSTAFTPAIALILGLHKVLEKMHADGLQKIWKRHQDLMSATREAIEALDLSLLASTHPSPAATGVLLPPRLDGTALLSYLRDTMGVDLSLIPI